LGEADEEKIDILEEEKKKDSKIFEPVASSRLKEKVC